MNFSVTNNRLKLSNGYDVSGSINTSSLLVGTSAGINPTSTLDVSGTANITGNLSVDTNTLFVDASNNRVGIGTTTPSEKLNINSGNLLMNGTFDGVLMNPGTGAGSLAITRSGNFINNIRKSKIKHFLFIIFCKDK